MARRDRSAVTGIFALQFFSTALSFHFAKPPRNGTSDNGNERDTSYRVETTFTTEHGLLIEGGGHLQWVNADGRTIIRERLYLDKANPDRLHDDITVIDNALTHPWSALKTYRRVPAKGPIWWR